MAVSLDKHLGVHATALMLRARRGEVLAANLANADTPNYKAKDIDFRAALARATAVSPVGLTATHRSHLGAPHPPALGGALLYRSAQQPSLDGNTVDTQIEQSAFAENAVKYQASLHFLGRRISGLLRVLSEE